MQEVLAALVVTTALVQAEAAAPRRVQRQTAGMAAMEGHRGAQQEPRPLVVVSAEWAATQTPTETRLYLATVVEAAVPARMNQLATAQVATEPTGSAS